MYRVHVTGLLKVKTPLSQINSILSRRQMKNIHPTLSHRESLASYSSRTQVIQTDRKMQNLTSTCIADKISIRQSTLEDISVVEQLAREEGWLCSNACLKAVLKFDPQTFIVAADESEIPVGYIGVCYTMPDTAYAFHIVVRKDLRGKGIGRKLNQAMYERLSDKNGYMDVDYRNVEFHRKRGFIYTSFKFSTFKGIVSSNCRGINSKKTQCNIVPVTFNELWYLVLDYDRKLYRGVDRERWLRTTLFCDETYTVAAVYNGKVKGYGSLAISTEDECISHLNTVFGDDQNIAEDIVGNLLENIPDGSSLTFNLMADKPLFDRFENFEPYSVQQRLYNKYILETGDVTDRMYCILSM